MASSVADVSYILDEADLTTSGKVAELNDT